jgi:hypothetical protein
VVSKRTLTVPSLQRDDNKVRRPYFIIDGYNLLHAAGLARRRYGPGQLARCRARLLDFLMTHLTNPELERTTVVFDAADAPPDRPRHLTVGGMTIRFAAAGKDADDTIEELIAAHSAPRQILVVSSDHRLQRSAQKRRGAFTDSEDFVQELERRGPTSGEVGDTETPQRPSSEKSRETETERWLRVFGEIPRGDELATDVGAGTSITQADVVRIQKEIDREAAQLPAKRGKRTKRPK